MFLLTQAHIQRVDIEKPTTLASYKKSGRDPEREPREIPGRSGIFLQGEKPQPPTSKG